MKSPINTRVDYEVGAAYVAYQISEPGEPTRMERISFDVRVEYTRHGDLLGIELLSLDAVTLRLAREFAARNELGFPSDLHAAHGTA